MEQQTKQKSGPAEATVEQTDETLSVVRQMMEAATHQEETSGAKKSVAPEKAVAPEIAVVPQKAVEPETTPQSKPAKPLATVKKKPKSKKSPKTTAKSKSELPEGFTALPELEPAPASRRNPLKRVFSLGGLFRVLRPRRKKPVAQAEFEPTQLVAVEPVAQAPVDPIQPDVVEFAPLVAVEPSPQTEPESAPQVAVKPAKKTTPGRRTLAQAVKELVQSRIQSVKEFRPTRKQIILVALIAIIVWRPWLIPVLLLLTLLVVMIGYLSLGPDRVGEITSSVWDRFSTRYPERAATVLGKVQRGADRVDGWLGRLPESWTDGVYLPDFGRSEAEAGPVDAQPDPFERLAAEQQAMAARSRQA